MNNYTLALLVLSEALIGYALADWSRRIYRGQLSLPTTINVLFLSLNTLYYGSLIAMAFMFAWWTPFWVLLLSVPMGLLVVLTRIGNTTAAISGSVLLVYTLMVGV